jgi:hypothetical protein
MLTVVTLSSQGALRALPAAHAAVTAVPAAHPAGLFDKTRVVLHLGIAYGVFHHWVYKPFKAGTLNLNHKVNLIKAGAALLFAVHEVRTAAGITSKSNDPILKKLNGVLAGIESKFQSVGNMFHNPSSNLSNADISSAINGLNSQVNASNGILNAPDAAISKLGSFQ